MTVSVVTNRKGGTRDSMMAAARKGKAVFEKHGAERFMLSQVTTGHEVGQWAVVIMFANWEAFGKTMQAVSDDPAFLAFVSDMNDVSELVSRRMLTSMDL